MANNRTMPAPATQRLTMKTSKQTIMLMATEIVHGTLNELTLIYSSYTGKGKSDRFLVAQLCVIVDRLQPPRESRY